MTVTTVVVVSSTTEWALRLRARSLLLYDALAAEARTRRALRGFFFFILFFIETMINYHPITFLQFFFFSLIIVLKLYSHVIRIVGNLKACRVLTIFFFSLSQYSNNVSLIKSYFYIWRTPNQNKF